MLSVILLSSCQNQREETVKEFTQWINKEIQFPDNMTFVIQNDTVDVELDSYDYKIVTYLDPNDCKVCNLKFLGWDNLMSKLEASNSLSIGLIYIIASDMDDDLEAVIQRTNYKRPICLDHKREFSALNHISKNKKFSTFLLDGNNKIVAIGFPFSENILDIYLSEMGLYDHVNGVRLLRNHPIEADRYSQSLGYVGDKAEVSFKFLIKNTLNHSVHIKDLSTSCPCMQASVNSDSIMPDQFATINGIYKPNGYIGEFANQIYISFDECQELLILNVVGFN